MAQFRRLFRFPWRTRAEVDREVDEELQFHVDMRADELIAQGTDPKSARDTAWQEFGNVQETRVICRSVDLQREGQEQWRIWLDEFQQDVRHAWRRLWRRPGFALTAILSMTVGLGVTVTLFSVVDPVLLQPLPFRDQDELVLMWEKDDASHNTHIEVSLPNFRDWRATTASFIDMAAMGSTTWGEVEIQQEPPIRLTVSAVSASFFDTLGAEALLGRTFLPEEDAAEAARVMVLSHGAWRQYFREDPDVVGRTVPVGAAREPHTVIGVMPHAFEFPPGAELWTPVGRELAEIFRENGMDASAQRSLGVLYVIGRLAPDTPREAAQAELDVIVPGLWESHFSRGNTRRVVIMPLSDYIFGNAKVSLFALLGGVVLLLLMTCVNVMGLMAVRSRAGRHDVAVRCALGLGRGRLFRSHLVETLLITAAAGLGGLALAHLALPLLVTLGPRDMPRLEQATVTGSTVVVTAALVLVCGLVMTLVAFLRTPRLSPMGWLRDDPQTFPVGETRARARQGLIAVQVATALALTVSAGLLTRSYLNLSQVDLGYSPDQVLTVHITPRDGAYATIGQQRAAFSEVVARVRRLPGVEAAGAAFLLPFEHGIVGVDGGVALEGESEEGPERRERPPIAFQAVSPGYFQAMGIDLLAGRTFMARDTSDAPGTVVIGESLARRLWPSSDAIGKRLVAVGAEAQSGGWQTVVGVVEDARYREIERPRFDLYLPFSQVAMDVHHLVVRTSVDPTTLAAAIRDEVHESDPRLVVTSVAALSHIVDGVMRPWQFNMTIGSVFAVFALGLAAIGLFGTVAHSVAQRTKEIGIRRALGAQAHDVLQLVARQAVSAALVGAGIGIGITLLVGEAIRPLLFGIAPQDPVAVGLLTALFLTICVVATLLAASRAARIDPTSALRTE